MVNLLKRSAIPLLGMLLVLSLVPRAKACFGCTFSGPTLSNEAAQAGMVLYGRMVNARLTDAADGMGQTDFVIEKVIKSHKIVEGKKEITLKRYVPPDKDNPTRYLIYCDVFQNTIDPYRGIPVKADSDMPKYIDGILKLKDAKLGDRLVYCFDFLNNDDIEIAHDALREFGNADDKDFAAIVDRLSVDKARAWLKDPKTPSYRYGLYATVVGHASKNKDADAAFLRSMLENPDKKVTNGIDGILASQALLQPKEGWEYLRKILADPKQTFGQRYNALRAARFFIDVREGIIARAEVVDAVALLLDHADIADLAIEDLRKWKSWEMTSRILALTRKKSHDISIIKRSILRFTLRSPSEEARAYVVEVRKRDPLLVKDIEQQLKLEDPPAPPVPTTNKAPK